MKNSKVLSLLLVLFLFLAGCGQGNNVTDNSDDSDQSLADTKEPLNQGASEQLAATSPSSGEPRLYTLEKYAQVLPSHSYEEVQIILGDPGENMVDNDRLKQFQWNNDDGSMISVTFYDNEMNGKGQAHLGPLLEGTQSVGKKQFEQLKEGMTLEEVTSLLGPGTERVFTIFDEEVEQIIGWENSDGSEISVTVSDGVVTKVTSLMLK